MGDPRWPEDLAPFHTSTCMLMDMCPEADYSQDISTACPMVSHRSPERPVGGRQIPRSWTIS